MESNFVKAIISAALLLLSTGAWCQTSTQDFSKGFELLAGLGMPALDADAKWAKVMDSDMMDYELREITKSIKGNGWIVRGKDGTVRNLALGGMAAADVEKGAKEAKPQDLAKDVETLIAAMAKAAQKVDLNDHFSSYRSTGNEKFLFFAAQLHQTGRKELAGRLAQAAFAFYPTHEAAVDAAVDHIAEYSHQQVVAAFFKSGDWVVYHRDLSTLTGKFPRGWKNLGAVRMMLPQLARQAKGEAAPEPALAGVTFDPQAVAIMRELMQPPEQEEKGEDELPAHIRRQIQMMRSMGHSYGERELAQSLWLIVEADAKDKQPLSRLAGLRMAAIPALAALTADPFFTRLPNSYSGGSYFSSRESDEERTLRSYQSMSRPSTRGEIAMRMLALTLPDPEDDLDEADAETMRDLAMEFWKTHRNATREELAAFFLKSGSRQQASTAAEVLAASKNPEAHKILETHVLAADQAVGMYQSVQVYLKARKAAGKPFFEKYAKLVRQQAAEGSDGERNENSWMIEQQGGVEKILKQLQALIADESPRKRVIRIAEEDPKTAAASIRGLMEAMSDVDPTEQLMSLLTGANAAKNEDVRAHFLGSISQIEWDTENEDEEESEEVKRAPRQMKVPEISIWRKLVQDTRPLKAASRFSMGVKNETVSALACSALEISVAGHGAYQELMLAMHAIARPAAEVISERAKARLDDKPVAPLPDADKVSKERLAAIVAEAGTKTAATLHEHLLTLIPDERAAWRAWLEDPGEIPAPHMIAELRYQVVKRTDSSPYGLPDMKDVGVIDVGFRVTVDAVEKHIQTLAAEAQKHSRGFVMIRNADFGPGLQILAFSLPFPEAKKDEDESEDDSYGSMTADRIFRDTKQFFDSDTESDALVIMQFSGTGNGSGKWSVKGGKATQIKTDDEEAGNLDALRTTLESTDAQRFMLTFRIITRADADKLFKDTESIDTDLLPPP